MKLQDFDFTLPEELIAHAPLAQRDRSRLLHVKQVIEDKIFSDILDLVKPGDVMVFNDTKVIPAFLKGKRGDATISCNLHKRESDDTWKAFAKNTKKARIDDTIIFSDDLNAQVTAKDGGELTLQFNLSGTALEEAIESTGEVPLPPYITSKRDVKNTDTQNYQTVFAKNSGAVAAPTAGLHYTDDLLQRLDARGVKRVHLTLHVGAGTFLPVKTEELSEHQMHSEFYTISADAAAAINEARNAGGRVIAVGTTSLRALESATDDNGVLQAQSADTDIFITPGYQFKMVDVLQTNFHIPKSTLFMLVSAFAGFDKMKEAYTHAIANKYRFYSYGDACWLER
jgi:S-adenosylmethionine:tRNA ribosyltransferase-isomerase